MAHIERDRKAASGKNSKLHSNRVDSADDQGSTERVERGEEHQHADDEWVRQLHQRVCRILEGHMLWICTKAEPLAGVFATHYWPTGRYIDDLRWLSPPSLIDTPVQLIKLWYCLELCQDKTWIRDHVQPRIDSWIQELHTSNERGTYAFHRKRKDQDAYYGDYESSIGSKYSLTDHVMIGLALKCFEQLEEDALRQENDNNPQSSTSEQPWCYYTYEEVRRKTLKRFTTQHPISRQQTFATSRWPHQTRFLLHSKDTFLFFAAKMGFFDQPEDSSACHERQSEGPKLHRLADIRRPADDRWLSLLHAQAYQVEYCRQESYKSLWYALVFTLGCEGTRIHKHSWKALVKATQITLLHSSWYNGMFPGSLGQDREPVPHVHQRDRDDYWFATFEIPNILWSFGTEKTSTISRKSVDSVFTKVPNGDLLNDMGATGTGQLIEKHVRFINVRPARDQANRNVVLDDWLLKSAAVFDFESIPHTYSTTDDTSTSQAANMTGVVIDVPKYSLGTEISREAVVGQISRILERGRTVWDSKKRIIWLSNYDSYMESKVHKACSRIESENVGSFFRLHKNAGQDFYDRVNAISNEWVTELHLSFFRIVDQRKGSLYSLEISRFLASTEMSFRISGDFSDRCWTCYFLERGTRSDKPQTLGLRLLPRRAYGIGGNLGLDNKDEPLRSAKRRDIRGEFRRHERAALPRSWQQRRVLELLIYSKMLKELHETTNAVLHTIRRLALRSAEVEKELSFASRPNPFTTAIEEVDRLRNLGQKDYSTITVHWRKYIQILRIIEANLADNIEKMKQWERREEDRQGQQPRWTYRDQLTHSSAIAKLTSMNRKSASEVDGLRKEVRTFHESLSSQIESIRNDMQFRDSQKINLFTYVTVVFLPLGFATGLLSMNGAPEHALLMNLVTVSLGALGVTLFALLMVKPLIQLYRLSLQVLWQPIQQILWQSIQHVHYVITARLMHYRFKKELSEIRSEMQRLATSPTDQDLERQSAAAEVKEPTKTEPWRKRWQQKYTEFMEFSYQNAKSEVQKRNEELLKTEKKKLAEMRKTAQTNGETMQPNDSRETLDRSEAGHRND